MDILLQDLRFAWRSLRRTPGYTAVVVTVLSLGIGVNTLVFGMVYGVLFRPWPLPEFDRVMTIQENNKLQDSHHESVSWLNYQDLRDSAKSFEAVGGYWDISGNVTIGAEPERAMGANITAGLLPALGIRPQLGRDFTPDEEVYGQNWTSILISDRIWRKRFGGTPDVIGKPLKFNGRVRTIVGVLPPDFHWPDTQDFWIPASIPPDDARTREDHNVQIAARLKPGVDPKQAQAEVDALYRRIVATDATALKGWTAEVTPFAEERRRDIRVMMIIMSCAVGFVLLIACANVANLMIARAAARKRELSVRLALGASRARVVRQMLTESLLLAFAGALIGVFLAEFGGRAWVSMIPLEKPFWMVFKNDLPVYAFTLGVSVVSALLFGLLPALQASDAKLAEAMREGSAQAGSGVGRQRARSALVVAEVALSLALLVGAGLMVRSIFSMLDSEKLVRSQGVYTARFLLPIATWPGDSARRVFCDQALPLVRQLPGVTSASIVSMLPLNRNNWARRYVGETGARRDPDRSPSVNLVECYPDYFETLGIPLIKGRDFTMDDGPGTEPVVIVNQSMAKLLWPGEDPLGRRVKAANDDRKLGWRRVVGVVPDVPQNLESSDRIMASIFVPHRQEPDQQVTWVLHTQGDPLELAPAMREFMRRQAPDVPLTDVRSMHESVKFSVWTTRLFGSLMAVFAVIALIIAGVGLYGVMAFSVAQRTQEIGIRMALGADARSVVNLVVGQAMQMLLVGTGIGLAAAFALTRGMATVLFGVSPTDPPTYLGVVLILTMSSVLAAWVPAHRATRVDPMRALRCD